MNQNTLPSRQGKSTAIERAINACIVANKSIIIGTSKPKERLQELRELFPEARFEICGMGVKLCSSK